MKKEILLLLFGFILFSKNVFSERNKEVGVVEYKKFEWKSSDYCYKIYTKYLFDTISNLGFKPEWIEMDIFLPENKTERDRYKRIVISTSAIWFTPEMYEGMDDYVKSGGLLITNSSLIGIDINRNYKLDEGDKYEANEIVGVYGHASAQMSKIFVEIECPLTKGIPVGEWISLEAKVAGRVTINKSATVLITSDRIYKEETSGNQPFLTYKHSGKGACIYIVPVLLDLEKNKYLLTILKNALSKETLEWLTIGE